MLSAIERVHQVTNGIPLSAQPNAGMPRAVEGRNIYLCSPEYMANYVPQFVAAGVRLIGGCCGTTPEHIKFMKSFVRADAAKGAASPTLVRKKPDVPVVPTLPLAERTRLGGKHRARRIRHPDRNRSSARHAAGQGNRSGDAS